LPIVFAFKIMKTSTLLMATLLGFAIATVQAQTQSSTTTSYVQTSKVVGMKVKDARGEEVGVVKDIVLDRNTGCMAYTVLSTGGTSTRVTGGGKTVVVPWTVYTATSDPSVLVVRVDREKVYNAPAFDYARIDEYSSSGWINNVYSYYGVTPGVGVGVGVSGTTYGTQETQRAQTGVSGQVNTAASPGASASPAATAMASPSASVESSAAASPRATTSPSTRASPGATASRRERASATPSSEAESTGERKTHHHGENRETASPSASSSGETTTEHATGKHRKTTSEEGTSESGSSKKSERNKSKSEPSEEAPAAEPSATP
jgi:sporulation protein YlmC with PRC-barrel domain